MKKYALPKTLVIKKRKDFERLFSDGKTIYEHPLKLKYLLVDPSFSFKVAFVVPSKLIKKSTKRNLIKRRMREAFRINKDKLQMPIDPLAERYNLLLWIYASNELSDFKTIENKIILILQRLNKEL
jgi:ribonuclease P protein component